MLTLNSEKHEQFKSVGILYTRDVTRALAETKDTINLFSNRYIEFCEPVNYLTL
jgi:hypothetical protein